MHWWKGGKRSGQIISPLKGLTHRQSYSHIIYSPPGLHVGGLWVKNRRPGEKPTQGEGEHVNFTQKGSRADSWTVVMFCCQSLFGYCSYQICFTVTVLTFFPTHSHQFQSKRWHLYNLVLIPEPYNDTLHSVVIKQGNATVHDDVFMLFLNSKHFLIGIGNDLLLSILRAQNPSHTTAPWALISILTFLWLIKYSTGHQLHSLGQICMKSSVYYDYGTTSSYNIFSEQYTVCFVISYPWACMSLFSENSKARRRAQHFRHR